MVILLKSNAVKDVATKEEFTKFFLCKTNYELVLERYLLLSGKPKGEYDMNDIFGDMLNRIDDELNTKDEKDCTWTF